MGADGKRAPDLSSLMVLSLEKLAAAGEVEAACRLAGEAYVLLRLSDPRGAQRFNALLHRLTRSTPPPPTPSRSEPP
jgi:hypothetical protein